MRGPRAGDDERAYLAADLALDLERRAVAHAFRIDRGPIVSKRTARAHADRASEDAREVRFQSLGGDPWGFRSIGHDLFLSATRRATSLSVIRMRHTGK
jgi:hypothetical protein